MLFIVDTQNPLYSIVPFMSHMAQKVGDLFDLSSIWLVSNTDHYRDRWMFFRLYSRKFRALIDRFLATFATFFDTIYEKLLVLRLPAVCLLNINRLSF